MEPGRDMKKGTEADRKRVRGQAEHRRLMADGYQTLESDWRLFRGAYWHQRYHVTDLKLGIDGRTIYVKTNIPELMP
jgi:hypothetical protein